MSINLMLISAKPIVPLDKLLDNFNSVMDTTKAQNVKLPVEVDSKCAKDTCSKACIMAIKIIADQSAFKKVFADRLTQCVGQSIEQLRAIYFLPNGSSKAQEVYKNEHLLEDVILHHKLQFNTVNADVGKLSKTQKDNRAEDCRRIGMVSNDLMESLEFLIKLYEAQELQPLDGEMRRFATWQLYCNRLIQ